MNKSIAVLLTLMAVLAGCGGQAQVSDEPPAPAPTVTVTATTTATATATATVTATPEARRPGESAIPLKGWLQLSSVKIRVLDFKGKPVSTYNERPTVAALVETCVTTDEEDVTLSWSPWAAVGGDNGRYPAENTTYNDYPLPEYPFSGSEVYTNGDCVRGWIVFGTTEKPGVTAVRYANDQGDIGVWTVE